MPATNGGFRGDSIGPPPPRRRLTRTAAGTGARHIAGSRSQGSSRAARGIRRSASIHIRSGAAHSSVEPSTCLHQGAARRRSRASRTLAQSCTSCCRTPSRFRRRGIPRCTRQRRARTGSRTSRRSSCRRRRKREVGVLHAVAAGARARGASRAAAACHFGGAFPFQRRRRQPLVPDVPSKVLPQPPKRNEAPLLNPNRPRPEVPTRARLKDLFPKNPRIGHRGPSVGTGFKSPIWGHLTPGNLSFPRIEGKKILSPYPPLLVGGETSQAPPFRRGGFS